MAKQPTPRRVKSTPVEALPKDVTVKGGQDEDQPLTEMQRVFVMGLVHHKLNLSAAARNAGFRQPASSATALMKNPKVIKAIAIEREEYAKASGMTKQKVIEGFAEAIDLARIKADPIAMIAGWREVGKMCGFYEPQKAEVRISVQGQVLLQQLNNMTDEQLLQMAEDDPSILEGEFLDISDQSAE